MTLRLGNAAVMSASVSPMPTPRAAAPPRMLIARTLPPGPTSTVPLSGALSFAKRTAGDCSSQPGLRPPIRPASWSVPAAAPSLICPTPFAVSFLSAVLAAAVAVTARLRTTAAARRRGVRICAP